MAELHLAPSHLWSMRLDRNHIMAETRAWLETVIERIVIHPVGSATGRRFDTSRVEIVWR